MSDELLTLEDVARMWKCSMRHARDVLVKLPGFPPEVTPPGTRRRSWSALHLHNYIRDLPLDTPGKFHLYRHFDRDGVLLYVGISLSSVARLSEHKRTSKWFERIARVEVERFHSRAASKKAEKEAIQKEGPLFNIHHARKQNA